MVRFFVRQQQQKRRFLAWRLPLKSSSMWVFVIAIWLILQMVVSAVAAAVPIEVFVLAGQSNMAGQGSVQHLLQLIHNSTTYPEYQHLWTGTSWKKRNDVFVRFDGHSGPLTVGYGDRYLTKFGPELEFGWVVGDDARKNYHRLHNNNNNKKNNNTSTKKILLIKTAWNGASLAIDFRPPSSGIGNYSRCAQNNDTIYDERSYQSQNNKSTNKNNSCTRIRPQDYGVRYRDMVSIVRDTLANLHAYVPAYSPADGYRIAGFVWFQGWNDVLDWNKINEYAINLQHLIQDIRLDLHASPVMPVVIGELGQAGLHPTGPGSDRHLAMRRIQQQVANRSEFRNNTRFVTTSPYVVANGEKFNGIYHYYGRADTVCHIGRAFGQAMIELIKIQRPTKR